MNSEKNNNEKILKNELSRVQREMTVLYEVSNAMRSTLELKDVLYIILTGVTSHTGLGYNRAILFLFDKSKRHLAPRMAIGPESGTHAKDVWSFITDSNQNTDDLIRSKNIAINISQSKFFDSIKDFKVSFNAKNNSFIKDAYLKGTPLHLKEKDIEKLRNDPFFNLFKTKELVVMPLKSKDSVNGLILADNLYTQKPITTDDLKMFEMLANQAGLAIENSRLYEMIIEKSNKDALTNLWNHGYFQKKLSEVLAIAKKNKLPTTLMIIDIDNFKPLNDNFGHQYGDIILSAIAKILRNSSRDIDYACRYGGEEFAIILSETNKKQAFLIAERIRKKVISTAFPKTANNDKVDITVSIGIASVPEDTSSKKDLIARADQAMYKAKFSGKNQTFAA